MEVSFLYLKRNMVMRCESWSKLHFNPYFCMLSALDYFIGQLGKQPFIQQTCTTSFEYKEVKIHTLPCSKGSSISN